MTPKALKGLNKIVTRFQKNIRKRIKNAPAVKVAISSVIRTTKYQKKLFGVEFVSTHSYGSTFDIFFDDYFVQLPESKLLANNQTFKTIQKKMDKKFGFLLGDALRQQFRSILMETLIQLQNEGVLYAILEKRQRCYHITILPG